MTTTTTTFSTVLAEVFEQGAEFPFASAEEERAAIRAAQIGNQDATVALIYAYAPALRRSTGQFRHAGGAWAGTSASEDLRMAAVEGLMEAIHAFDPDRYERLAATIAGHLAVSAASSFVGPVALSVPVRTLTRFYGILRAAGGDPVAAELIAPEYEMKHETFRAVLEAVRAADTLDTPTDGDEEGYARATEPVWDGRYADAEDRILAEAALGAVTGLERDVVEFSYGFRDYDPTPDAETGHRLGVSIQKVRRARTAALGNMRNALGVA